MSKSASKTRIVEDGLRYQSKVGGSPFLQNPNFKQSMMSCFLCGTHRERTQMTTRKLIGKSQLVCAPSCKAAKEADTAAIQQRDKFAICGENADTDKLVCQKT